MATKQPPTVQQIGRSSYATSIDGKLVTMQQVSVAGAGNPAGYICAVLEHLVRDVDQGIHLGHS